MFLAVQRRPRCLCICLWFRDPSPDDGAGKDLIKRLKDDQPVFEVLEQVEHAWFDAERVQPEGEDTRFTFALGIEIFDRAIVFGFLLVERGEAGPGVEEVGDEREVEAGVSGDEGGRGQIFATADGSGVLEDLFCTLTDVSCLERSTGAFVWLELVEKYGVVFAIGYVAAKVVYPEAVVIVRDE